jgi:predicted nucleotidyltransferase
VKFDEEAIVRDIVEAMPDAIEIWFHGSRARGDHKRNSDWDILVIVADGTDPHDSVERLKPLNPPRRLDDRKRAELDIQAAWESDKTQSASVAYWAVEEGRMLYERPEPTAGTKP